MLMKLKGNALFIKKSEETKESIKKEVGKKLIDLNSLNKDEIDFYFDKYFSKKKKPVFCIDEIDLYDTEILNYLFDKYRGIYNILCFNKNEMNDVLEKNIKHIYF